VLGQFLGVDAPAADRVAREYPLLDYAGSTSWATASVLTDWGWGCPAADVNGQLSRENPTFAYEFSDRTAPWFAGPDVPPYPPGAFHAGAVDMDREHRCGFWRSVS
jgi:para-nitrobenzyl esterase